MVAPLAMLGLSLVSGIVDSVAGAVGNAAKPAATDKTRQTANDFETMFLEQSLDRLTQSTGDEGPLGQNGEAGGIYKSMLSKEYAKSIVKSGGVGIAGQVYAQMLKMQEKANGAGSP